MWKILKNGENTTRVCARHALKQLFWKVLKGKKSDFFYRLKVFIGPKLRQVSKGNFHRKAPKWVKNQVKGSKIDQIRTKWHPTCWGNPPILSLELLRESINSVLRPTEGILLLTISASDLLRESTDSVIGATEGIHQFCHPTYWGNPHAFYRHLPTSGRQNTVKMGPQPLFAKKAFVLEVGMRLRIIYVVHADVHICTYDKAALYS